MSMLRLRRGICGATDVAAGLDKTGLELGEERGQGRFRVESSDSKNGLTRRHGGPREDGEVFGNCDCFSGTGRGRPSHGDAETRRWKEILRTAVGTRSRSSPSRFPGRLGAVRADGILQRHRGTRLILQFG